MTSKSLYLCAVAAAAIAAFYQFFLSHLLFTVIGIRRVMQPLEDFPYSCQRLRHPMLEACEDAWLDDEGRRLYLTCTGTNHRLAWNPKTGISNVTGRRPGGAFITVLNIDEPGDDGFFGVHQLNRGDYKGTMGDGSMDFFGFDVQVMNNDVLTFYIVNTAPPVDENFRPLDPIKAGGAHASIQVFEHKRGEGNMDFVTSFEDPIIGTPNNVALTGEGGLLFTNDHSAKVGLKQVLEVFTGGGSVGYCSLDTHECHTAFSSGLNFPNGLVRGSNGLYYVPNTLSAKISVLQLQPDHMLKEVDNIQHTMALDNFATDAKGDIWAPGFPSPKFFKHINDPWNHDSPSTIWRWQQDPHTKSGLGRARKMLEDREAKAVSGATVVRHDVRTGRLFMGGAMAPYISVCEPRE